MRILHIDPFGGVAGDMLLGALLDAGAPQAAVEAIVRRVAVPGWRLAAARQRHGGFAGMRVTVEVEEESHPARHLADVEALLAGADLPGRVGERALTTFRRLFDAEAAVHGLPVEKVHLHEVAAVDAVVDIVGTCAAIELLDVARISADAVPVGRGSVQTAHGLLPVPPPAVSQLLHGVPLAGHAAEGEMTTPTGAALITTLAEAWSPLPPGRVVASGVGMGARTFPGMPNILRAFVLDVDEPPSTRRLSLVEATVDDATGEHVAWVIARLMEAGALDAWTLVGTGRKGRPVTELRCLCEHDAVDAMLTVVFAAGFTLGARVLECRRPELERAVVSVETGYGPIPVKVGVHRGLVVSAKPEHDACRAAADRAGVALAAVEAAARDGAPRPGSEWSGADRRGPAGVR